MKGGNKSESSHSVADASNQWTSNNRRRSLIICNYVAKDFNVLLPKSAREDVVRKVIYCVNNVNNSTTRDELVDFITKMPVQVLTCFKIKQWISMWQKSNHVVPVKDHRTFRVCIQRDEASKFLNSDRWPRGITILAWFHANIHQSEQYRNEDNSTDNRTSSQNKSDAAMTSNPVHDWFNLCKQQSQDNRYHWLPIRMR